MQTDDPSAPTALSASSCLCSALAASSASSSLSHGLSLRCGNVWAPYTLEARLAHELAQSFEASPAARFIVSAEEEEQALCVRVSSKSVTIYCLPRHKVCGLFLIGVVLFVLPCAFPL
jgi:hypothetical protein